MARGQGAALDRKKLLADPIMVTTIVLLITFLTLFILYPLAILLVDSFVGDGSFGLSIFKRIFAMPSFTRAITNTLKVGFVVGILSTLIGLLFAYVEVYVRMNRFVGGLFKVVSMLPVVSPPFVLSLSMIMLFGKAGLITRFLLHIYDNSVYGYWGIVIVQTLTFFPVCYMMLKGLLKNIDPSLEEAAGYGRRPLEGLCGRDAAADAARPGQRLPGDLYRVHCGLCKPHDHRRLLRHPGHHHLPADHRRL